MWHSFRDLLRFLDRYPMDVPIKGGSSGGSPESSSSPLTWSPETGTLGGLRALERRIDEIRRWTD